MVELVTLGETMVLFTPLEKGPLRYVNTFCKKIAGAESNVAIGVSKLGHSVAWISRLGDDEFGKYILSVVKGEGVNTTGVVMDPDHPTGVFFRERKTLGSSRVYYYRSGSAASYLSPSDVKEEFIKEAKYLHLTGITPALSESCMKVVEKAITLARKNETKIIFDPNLRFKLWDKKRAKKVITGLVKKADIILPGIEEAKFLFGDNDNEELAKSFISLGAEIVCLKLGSDGSLLITDEGIEFIPGYPQQVVDPVGAGDAFAAGFIAGLLDGNDFSFAAKMANACGAFAVTVAGDIEALPDNNDLHDFFAGREDVMR